MNRTYQGHAGEDWVYASGGGLQARDDKPKCRCGAYAKPGLLRRKSRDPVCAPCYDASWDGHGVEWEAEMRQTHYDDDYYE